MTALVSVMDTRGQIAPYTGAEETRDPGAEDRGPGSES